MKRYTNFRKTKDPNVIERIETTVTEISLNELEDEIGRMSIELEATPDDIMVPTDKEQIAEGLKSKQDFLKTLQAL